VTVLELVGKIIEAMGSNIKADVHDEASNEIREQFLNSTKAKKLLVWQPLFTLEEGLRRTIEWYRVFLGGYV
jgi:CDP-glucose 4,6-dehydratase